MVILVLHALINIFSSHLVALFNNISVFWHVRRRAVIIGILIIVPDHHQSADFVFTERINNSGFARSTSDLFWCYVLPAGFLLTMYTVTGLRRLRARGRGDAASAEHGGGQGRLAVGRSLSALIGWFVLLAITFAATDVEAVNDARRHLAGDLHERDVRELGRGRDPDLGHRPVLLRHGVRDQLLAHVLRVLARPGDARAGGCGAASTEAACRSPR